MRRYGRRYQKSRVSFNSCASVNIEQARKLYIDIIEEYLRYVNEDEEVRPYLHNYPFTPVNLYFLLGFRENNQSIKGEGHVASIVISRNIVYYDAYHTNSKKLYNLHKETYEEALSIVKENNQITVS